MAYSTGSQRHPVLWPFLVSLTGHLLLFGFILYRTTASTIDETLFMPAVIEVKMVEMPASEPVQGKKVEKTPDMEKVPVDKEPATFAAPESSSAPKPEVSIAPPRPKEKTPLKYKTFKTKKVLQNALDRLEKKVETTTPKPLEDTIKRLREKVENEGRPDSAQTVAPEASSSQGKKDGYAVGSKEEGEAIDIYRLEVAYAINKHWAFSEQLAGRGNKLMAALQFKVYPDGQIKDIYFFDRSSNDYLNESAMKAIIKASPVKPHPEGLNRPYVEMGLRFTPQGVQ